jgi:hypothetical protein
MINGKDWWRVLDDIIKEIEVQHIIEHVADRVLAQALRTSSHARYLKLRSVVEQLNEAAATFTD